MFEHTCLAFSPALCLCQLLFLQAVRKMSEAKKLEGTLSYEGFGDKK